MESVQTGRAPDVHLRLLGGFEMRCGGDALDVPEASQRVLVMLALTAGPCSRPRLAGTLWPTKPEERAAANLRSALWRLPKVEGRPVVLAHAATVELAGWVTLDVRLCEDLGWALVRGEHGAIDDRAKSLFVDEMLPGWYDEWLTMERERMGQLQLHFLEALAFAYLSESRYAEAMDAAMRLVAADPLRERSQRTLIAAYLAEGNRNAARRQVAGYRRLLLETFGCEPSAELTAMVDPPGDAGDVPADWPAASALPV